MTTNRLEAFSDGVLAIAATLLVLDLHVPGLEEGDLVRALLRRWPAYAAYAVSFLVIGIIWVNHHTIFHRIRQVDRPLLFLNLLLLMCVSVIPFPTELLAARLQSGPDARVAAAVYSITMFFVSVAFNSLWGYALLRGDLLEDALDIHKARAEFPRFAVGVLLYAALIGVALANAAVCLASHAAVALYYVFDTVSRKSPTRMAP